MLHGKVIVNKMQFGFMPKRGLRDFMEEEFVDLGKVLQSTKESVGIGNEEE